jgi:hypothetical protein
VQSVEGFPTLTLKDFLKATMKVQNKTKASIVVVRSAHAQALSGDIGIKDFKDRVNALATPQDIQKLTLVLHIADYYNNLGYANMDAAPPIQPGAISPHKDRGRMCADCHVFMNTGGQLAVDAGDIVPNPPAINKGSPCPHEARGQCNFCHRIIDPQNKSQAIPQTSPLQRNPRGCRGISRGSFPGNDRYVIVLLRRVGASGECQSSGADFQPGNNGSAAGAGRSHGRTAVNAANKRRTANRHGFEQ